MLADMRFPRAIDAMRKGGIVVEAIDLYDFGRIGMTPSMLAVDLKRVSARMRIAIFPTFTEISSGSTRVLADLQNQGGADVIVAAGDLCMDGPKPKKVLQRLQDIGAQCIRGNTDRYCVRSNEDELRGSDEGDRKQTAWTRSEIGEKRLDVAARTAVLAARSARPATNCSSFTQIRRATTSTCGPMPTTRRSSGLIGDEEAGTIAFGHLHLPYVRMWRGKLLVNVSSAGLPKDGDPRAGYAIFTAARPAAGRSSTAASPST